MTSSLAPHMQIGSIAAQAFDADEPPTFREVMAYLDGVAAAMSANRRMPPPVSLVPCATPASSSSTPCSVGGMVSKPAGDDSSCRQPTGAHPMGKAQLTLRQGELSGAVDRILGGAEAPDAAQVSVRFRNTVPYGVEPVSVAPRGPLAVRVPRPAELAGTPAELARSMAMLDAALEKEGDRTSDVYLRCARLSAEWYDLTGTAEK
jgi:hypothetical protein